MAAHQEIALADENVLNKIYHLRDKKVMLDSDLVELYVVETRVLNQAVARNSDRFPEDFMFQLTMTECGGRRTLPFVFTERGIAMLSSVLKSPQAIQINIQIMRIFTRIRQLIVDNTPLRLEIEKIKKKLENHSQNIELIFKYVD